MDKNELLWRQYSLCVDLFKFYMELLIKFNVFYYAVTGAIASFVFANPGIANVKFSLFVPLVISCAFAGFFWYGRRRMNDLNNEVIRLKNALGLQDAPNIQVASIALCICAWVLFINAAGCLYVLLAR